MTANIRKGSWVGAGLLGLAAVVGLLTFAGDGEAVNKAKVRKARALTRGVLQAGKIHPKAPVSPSTVEGMLCEDVGNNGGARIRTVRQDSAAFQAGLVAGDVIFGVEDQQVNTVADLDALLGQAMGLGQADVVLSVIDVNTGQSTLVPMQIVPLAGSLKKAHK